VTRWLVVTRDRQTTQILHSYDTALVVFIVLNTLYTGHDIHSTVSN